MRIPVFSSVLVWLLMEIKMNQIAGSVRFPEKFCESCSINWGISFLINGSGRSGRRVTDWHILKRNLSVEKKKKLKTQSKEAYYKLKSKLAITGNNIQHVIGKVM